MFETNTAYIITTYTFLGFFITFTVLFILFFWKYYKLRDEMREEEAKDVKKFVLRDFSGRKQVLGDFVSYDLGNGKPYIEIDSGDPTKNDRYEVNVWGNKIEKITVVEDNEIWLLTDFNRTDLGNKIIHCAYTPELIEMGFTKGFKFIKLILKPIILENRYLTKLVNHYQDKITTVEKNKFAFNLAYLQQMRESFSGIIVKEMDMIMGIKEYFNKAFAKSMAEDGIKEPFPDFKKFVEEIPDEPLHIFEKGDLKEFEGLESEYDGILVEDKRVKEEINGKSKKEEESKEETQKSEEKQEDSKNKKGKKSKKDKKSKEDKQDKKDS